MAQPQPIDPAWVNRATEAFGESPLHRVARNAVTGEGVSKAARDITRLRAQDRTFTVSLKHATTVTNQRQTGRCWLFSTYNPLRARTMALLDVDDFEFSQAYGQFYDKLEKAAGFLQWVWETADEPWEGREVTRLFEEPIPDGGMWAWGANLVEKWGMVPKGAMDDSACARSSKEMNQVLARLLRARGAGVRELVAQGASDTEVQDAIDDALMEVHGVLCTCLGEPPTTFDFSCQVGPDAKVDPALLEPMGPTEGPGARSGEKGPDSVLRDRGLTPRRFVERYVGFSMDDHVELVSFPMEELPYGRVFSIRHGDPMVGGVPGRYLNVPMEVLERSAAASLMGGQACYFACDVGQSSPRALEDFPGILAMDSMDLDDLFGCSFAMDRDTMYRTRESSLTHAMTLQGLTMGDDGRPSAWQVENSWGKDSCDQGYYLITGDWFRTYAADVVVDRSFVDGETLAAWDEAASDPSKVVWVEPWSYIASALGGQSR